MSALTHHQALLAATANYSLIPHASTYALLLTSEFTNSGTNVTFFDQVQLQRLVGSTPTPTSRVKDAGFEQVVLPAGGTVYSPGGSPWLFGDGCGLQANNSAFSPPAAPQGTQTGFVQGSDQYVAGTITQALTLMPATYRLLFSVAPRRDNATDAYAVAQINGLEIARFLVPAQGYYDNHFIDCASAFFRVL